MAGETKGRYAAACKLAKRALDALEAKSVVKIRVSQRACLRSRPPTSVPRSGLERGGSLSRRCSTDCPCLCHDGFGGAHPGRRCRDAVASGNYVGGPND